MKPTSAKIASIALVLSPLAAAVNQLCAFENENCFVTDGPLHYGCDLDVQVGACMNTKFASQSWGIFNTNGACNIQFYPDANCGGSSVLVPVDGYNPNNYCENWSQTRSQGTFSSYQIISCEAAPGGRKRAGGATLSGI